EAEVVPALEESGEALVRLVEPTEVGEGLDEPERADDERALAAGKAVRSQVPVDELRAREMALDGVDGRGDAGIVRRQEPDQRDDEERGIEVAAGRAGERAEHRAVAVLEDPRADRVAGAREWLEPEPEVARASELDGALQPDPGHDLGVDVLRTPGTDLPDPVIGLRPVCHDDACQTAQQPACIPVELAA